MEYKRKELFKISFEQLKENGWSLVLYSVIVPAILFFIFALIGTIPILGIIVIIPTALLLSIGISKVVLNIIRKNEVSINELFVGFKDKIATNLGTTLLYFFSMYLVIAVICFGLLASYFILYNFGYYNNVGRLAIVFILIASVIPLICYRLKYATLFYCLADNKDMKAKQVRERARNMMYGHKKQLLAIWVIMFLVATLVLGILGFIVQEMYSSYYNLSEIIEIIPYVVSIIIAVTTQIFVSLVSANFYRILNEENIKDKIKN